MRKIGLLLFVLCFTSVSFGISSFEAKATLWFNPAVTGPFMDTDWIDLIVRAMIPDNAGGPMSLRAPVTREGNTFLVEVNLNNLPGMGFDQSLTVLSGLGPLAAGTYNVLVTFYGTANTPFGPIADVALGSASHTFVVWSPTEQPWLLPGWGGWVPYMPGTGLIPSIPGDPHWIPYF